MEANTIIQFWFNEISPESWFKNDEAFDAQIKERFLNVLEKAKKAELFTWRSSAAGRLAEIIVLDQFSRNVYRDNPKAFEADSMALVLAQEMVALKWDAQLPIQQRAFCYMPYMHSESLSIHQEAVQLFDIPGLENNLKFEIAHQEIIEKFGRYPHRNQILGRTSTPEELTFLKTHKGF